MPASYIIDRAGRLVFSRGWGILTERDVAEHYRDIAADPGFDPSFAQLVDLRDVEHIDMSAPSVRREALEVVFRPRTQRAFVARSEEQTIVARLYGLFGSYVGQNIRVFAELSDAERWLGLSPVPDRGAEQRRQDLPEQRAEQRSYDNHHS